MCVLLPSAKNSIFFKTDFIKNNYETIHILGHGAPNQVTLSLTLNAAGMNFNQPHEL